MKYTISAAVVAVLAAKTVVAHATFQELWVDGVDQGTTCARLPLSNSPVTDVTSKDMACNAGTSAVSSKCSVKAGSIVTVEMHQQPNDRSCTNEAIGGAHYGPVLVYMAAVKDASSAVGADSAWFKIFEDTWASGGASGSADHWGTKDLNTCCGRMDVAIPADIPSGDYLLRAEAIALHAAGGQNGAQMYMTCYQVTVEGGGSAAPPTVSFPGAYLAADPGILINIYQSMTTYVAPGPTVYAGGSTRSAGAACANCESTCAAGSGASTSAAGAATSAKPATTLASSSAKATSVASSSAAVRTSAASSGAAAAASSSSASKQAATTLATKASSASAVGASTTTAKAASATSIAPIASASPSSTAKKTCSSKRRRHIARKL